MGRTVYLLLFGFNVCKFVGKYSSPMEHMGTGEEKLPS